MLHVSGSLSSSLNKNTAAGISSSTHSNYMKLSLTEMVTLQLELISMNDGQFFCCVGTYFE